MAANWNLAEPFLGGASLAARIADQRAQRAIETRRDDNEASYRAGELGVAESRAANDTAELPSKIADTLAQTKQRGQMGDYYSGKNAAYLAAAQARAAAGVGSKNLADIQKELKVYDDKASIDPDGSKGIYTPGMATMHAALWNRYSTLHGIAGAPATANTFVNPPKPGFISRAATNIGNYFSGGAAAPAAAEKVRKGSDGKMYRFDAENNYLGPAGG